MLLNCKDTNTWREKCLNRKWLHVNDEVAFEKPVRCSRTTDLKTARYIFVQSEV